MVDMNDEGRSEEHPTYPDALPGPKGQMVDVLPQSWDAEGLLREIEADCEKEGWDQPGRLYGITGEPGSYTYEQITTITGYPPEWIKIALLGDYLEGIPPAMALPPDVKGVVLVMEMWKHPDFNDLKNLYPEVFAKFVKSAEALGIDPSTEEGGKEFKRIISAALDRAGEDSSPSEAQYKAEMRTAVALMRDGTALQFSRVRHVDEGRATAVGDGTNVIRAMRALLTGCWPADLGE